MFAEKYGKGERPPVTESECPFYELICKCWHTLPENRPVFAAVFQDLNIISEKVGKRNDDWYEHRNPKAPVHTIPLEGFPVHLRSKSSFLMDFKEKTAFLGTSF